MVDEHIRCNISGCSVRNKCNRYSRGGHKMSEGAVFGLFCPPKKGACVDFIPRGKKK